MKPLSRHLERPLDLFFLALIGVYQRRISPRKGWRCAHSVLYGGPGCSGFVRESIEAHGYRAAIALARERFNACKMAARTLRASRQDALQSLDKDKEPKPTRRVASGAPDCIPDPECCLCAETAFDVGPHIAGICDMGACHAGACDAGLCDAGACHVGICDCFACS